LKEGGVGRIGQRMVGSIVSIKGLRRERGVEMK